MSLHQNKVLITREKTQAKAFAKLIKDNDGIPIEVPLLKIECQSTNIEIDKAYQWIFFTSANGVNCFFEQYKLPHGVKIAAVGLKTKIAIEEHGYTVAFMPSTFNAETMAEEFLEKEHPFTSSILLIRGNRSRKVLPQVFKANGLSFDLLEVYKTSFNRDHKETLNRIIEEGNIDFLTFTSPSTIQAFTELLSPSNLERVKTIVCVCIGTTTGNKADEMGFQHTLIPDEFTIEGMVRHMKEYLLKERTDME